MTIDDVFKNHSSNIAICMVDEEEGMLEIEKFHKEFNDNYQIVPKEQWCVTMTLDGNINATAGQGPFESKKIAEKFADIWNRMRDDEIEQIITNEPDKEHSFFYIKAKAIPLSISEKNLGIMKEIEDGD